MKKNSLIFAALCAIALVSCNKTVIEEVNSVRTVSLPVSVEVTAPGQESKIVLDPETYAQTWKAGDEIHLGSYLSKDNAGDGTARVSNNTLTATGSGAGTIFSGTASLDSLIFAKISKVNNYIIAPASSWTKTLTNNQYVKVPVTQSGKIEDFGKYSVSYSPDFKITSDGDKLSFPTVGKMLNLCPAIRFKIAEGLDVRKIVIKGYTGGAEGVETLLAAERANTVTQNDAIQIKITSDILYQTRSNTNTLTIDRTPDNEDFSQKEEISGDVFAVLAPNFPQTYDKDANPGKQWDDKKTLASYKIYDNLDNLDFHRPYNTCDYLVFTFYNSLGDSYEFKAPLNDKLYSGKIKKLGNITKIPFPIPECVFSIDAVTGNLMCSNGDKNVKMYYSISISEDGTEPAEPSNPIIDESNLFPEAGIEITSSLTNAKIKILPVRNGMLGVVYNAFLKKFNAKDNKYDMVLAPNENGNLGFINFTNTHETYYLKFNYSSGYCNYKHYRTSDTSKNKINESDESNTNIAPNGQYAVGTFASKYPNATADFYFQQHNKNRRVYFKYTEGETVIKPEAFTNAKSATSDWFTSSVFSTETNAGNGVVTVTLYTDSTPIKGFAWLEQGFESF